MNECTNEWMIVKFELVFAYNFIKNTQRMRLRNDLRIVAHKWRRSGCMPIIAYTCLWYIHCIGVVVLY